MERASRRVTSFAAVLGIASIVACASRDTPSGDHAPVTTLAPPSPAQHGRIDPAAVVRQVHFAFRPDGAGLLAEHATYAARVEDGALSFRASRRDAAATSLSLHLRGVTRDGRRLDDAPSARIDHDGHAVLERGAVTEHLRNDDDGTEQSWDLAARPPGIGDLVVRLAASGAPYAGETSSGHHFHAAGARYGVRYGGAAWVDARGARTSLPIGYDGGDLVVTIPAAVVDSAAYPASIDPTIGPELPIDDPAAVPDNGTSQLPAIDSNGSESLVAWTWSAGTSGAVYAARISSTGVVLDVPPIQLATGSNTAFGDAPTVVATNASGGDFFVAWPTGSNVDGIWVHADGSLGSTVSLTPNGTEACDAVAAASNGSTDVYLAASCGAATWGTILTDGAGAVSGTAQTLASKGTTSLGAAYAAGRFLVVSQAVGYMVADTTGLAVGSPLGLPDTGIAPKVASDGTNFVVVDSHAVGTTATWVQTTPIAAATETIGASLVLSTDQYNGSAVSIAYAGGTSFYVAWPLQTGASTFTLEQAEVTSGDTTVSGATQVVTYASDKTNPVVTGSGLLAWSDDTTGTPNILAAKSASFVGATTLVSDYDIEGVGGENSESTPSVAWASNANEWLVAWADVRGATSQAQGWAARVSSTGTVLDPYGINYAPPASLSSPLPVLTPQASSDENGFWIVWSTGDASTWSTGRVYASYVSSDGAVTTSAKRVSNSEAGQIYPVAAGNLFAWVDYRNSPSINVYGAFGATDSAGIQIVSTATVGAAPMALASAGTTFDLVWQNDAAGLWQVYERRLTNSGTLKDTSTLGAAGSAAQSVAVASDGTRYLATVGLDAYGISSTGTVSAAIPLPLPASAVAAAWDGASYWVVSPGDGVRVSQGFSLVDTSAIPLTTDAKGGTASLAGGPFRELLFAYVADAPVYPATRAQMRLIDDHLSQGTACGTTADCEAGACIDGYCCGATTCTGCQGCSNAKTGQPNGTCADVVNGTDPNGACTLGVACASATCESGACATTVSSGSCYIDSACYAANAPNPGNACQTCQPGTSGTAWTDANGTSCDDGNACTKNDTCSAGTCGGTAYTCTPTDCQASSTCDGTGGCNTTPKADGSTCTSNGVTCEQAICESGSCTHPLVAGTCYIASACYSADAPNPSNACQTCQPGKSTSTWTNDDGVSCNDGNACTKNDTCSAGTCGGTAYTCTPTDCQASSTCDGTGGCNTTPKADGSTCTSNGVTCEQAICESGSCTHPLVADTCYIASACYSANAPNPSNACQTCQPGTSTSTWTNDDGVSCNDGNACTKNDTCSAGTCGGTAYTCTPTDCQASSTCDGTGGCNTTPKTDGSSCTSNGVSCELAICESGSCTHPIAPGDCFIAGTCYASGAPDPSSSCESCQPGVSPTAWTPIAGCGVDAAPPPEDASAPPDASAPTDAGAPPDATSGEPDATSPTDASAPPDASSGEPDATTPPVDASAPPDATTGGQPDATTPPVDGSAPPDATSEGPDASTPPDDAGLTPDATTPPPDASPPTEDAAGPVADAALPSADGAVAALDSGADGSVVPSSSTTESAGCACRVRPVQGVPADGAGGPAVALLSFGLMLARRRKRRRRG